CQLFRRCNLKLVGYVFFSTRCRCFGLQIFFLLFRPHQPAKRNCAILDKDFYVASVHGETLIPMDRFSDFLRECTVRRSHLLLIRSRSCLMLAFLCVVWTLLDFLVPQDWCG